MNRSHYFNYIEEKLNLLSLRIAKRGKINLLDLNIYSESFFAELMNRLLGYNLININTLKQNTEAIDLIDSKHKIIAQVSSTCSVQKIENALSKKLLVKYSNYRFIFLAISGDAEKLRNKTFKNPYHVEFNPMYDIYDIKSLLNLILTLSIRGQRELFEFIKGELGSIVDIVRLDTNLASLINILSKENLVENSDSLEVNSFEILRKIEFNDLCAVQPIIDDYKIYHSRLDDKYREFDKQGSNKSFSVLSIIRKQYNKLIGKNIDSCEIFYLIIDEIIKVIVNSKNYVEIPYEELELCVSILVVDAFIRCKIFKNPEGYNYAVTR